MAIDPNDFDAPVKDYAFNEVLNKLLTTVLFLTHQFLNGNSTPKPVLPSGSVFTEKLCIQSFLKMWLCFGSVKPSKLTKSLYLLIETTLNHLDLQYFK